MLITRTGLWSKKLQLQFSPPADLLTFWRTSAARSWPGWPAGRRWWPRSRLRAPSSRWTPARCPGSRGRPSDRPRRVEAGGVGWRRRWCRLGAFRSPQAAERCKQRRVTSAFFLWPVCVRTRPGSRRAAAPYGPKPELRPRRAQAPPGQEWPAVRLSSNYSFSSFAYCCAMKANE